MMNAVSFLVLLSVCTAASATDGYFSNGYGTQCKALAGACTALSLDAMATATNPAGMLGAGRRYDLSVNLFMPNRDFVVTGSPSGVPGTFGLASGKVSSASPLFLLPSFGMNFLFGTKSSVGISLYVNGGLNTNYPAPVYGQAPTGVDARQVFLTPTFAHCFGTRHTFGVAPIVAYQEFKASGLASFASFSSDPKAVSNNGWSHSFGLGIHVGYLGQLTSWLTVGAAYRSVSKMQDFAKYSGLFASQGSFDIPAAYNVGVAAKASKQVTLSGDFQRTLYSSIPSVHNPMLPNLFNSELGADGGAGFGWRDLTVGRAAVQVDLKQNWTLRGGVSQSGQTVPKSEVLLNLLTPAVLRTHLTVGATRSMGSKALHLAIVHAFSSSLTGSNALELPRQQTITLRMDQWEVEAGVTFGRGR